MRNYANAKINEPLDFIKRYVTNFHTYDFYQVGSLLENLIQWNGPELSHPFGAVSSNSLSMFVNNF